MTSSQNTLIMLIACYLKSHDNVQINYEEFDLENIYKVAKSHDILPLLYASLKKYGSVQIQEQLIYKHLKDVSIYQALRQEIHIENVISVIQDFNKENIPVIVLKGLTLRQLYPIHSLRTMCDADLLIKKADIALSKNILERHGYQDSGKASFKDYHMCHKNNLPIELHWSIMNDTKKENKLEGFINEIWENAVPFSIGNAQVLSLSPNDSLVHLIIHMAEHFYKAGIGIRQLCDLYLYLDKLGNKICWDKFNLEIELLSLKRFFYTLLSIGSSHFFVDIPDELKSLVNSHKELCNELFEDIINGGTFGRINMERSVSNRFQIYVIRNKSNKISKIRTIINFMFPCYNLMQHEYQYIQKYSILLPISWIHRYFFNIFRKEKTKIIKSIINSDKKNNSIELLKKRERMFEWLSKC